MLEGREGQAAAAAAAAAVAPKTRLRAVARQLDRLTYDCEQMCTRRMPQGAVPSSFEVPARPGCGRSRHAHHMLYIACMCL